MVLKSRGAHCPLGKPAPSTCCLSEAAGVATTDNKCAGAAAVQPTGCASSACNRRSSLPTGSGCQVFPVLPGPASAAEITNLPIKSPALAPVRVTLVMGKVDSRLQGIKTEILCFGPGFSFRLRSSSKLILVGRARLAPSFRAAAEYCRTFEGN